MIKLLEIAKLISTDVRSRSNAKKIVDLIDNNTDEVVLDFKNVSFISRSFSDELCTIIENRSGIRFSEKNMSHFVGLMFHTVQTSRNKKRKRNVSDNEIINIDNMDSLSDFFVKNDMSHV